MISLALARADVAPPRRAELELVEIVRVPHVGMVALQHTVQPPFQGSAPHVGVPFDAMPRTQRNDRSIDVRISPPIVARVLRQHMQPAIGTQYYELLSPGRAAAIKKEGNFVAIGTKIERR